MNEIIIGTIIHTSCEEALMYKKISDQTNGLALFWTYFYIRICLESNDLAMSYTETANSSATVSAQICPLFI